MPRIIALAIVLGLAAAPAASQSGPRTAEQDRQAMLDRLGITALRPGANADPSASDHANYDEAQANPFGALPDPLVMADGRPVTSAAMWWRERRPELVAAFEREVYGRVPADAPAVRWEVRATDRERLGWPPRPIIARQLVGHVDNRADPAIEVAIRMTVVTPADAKGPVPVLIMFQPDDWPAPNLPDRAGYERINAALKAAAVREDPSLAAVFAAHPAFAFAAPPPFHFPPRNADGDPPNAEELIAAGWGYAMLDPASIQPDDGAGLARGVIGLTAHGGERRPEDWGALRAWARGASRAFDYLVTLPEVDAHRIGIEGVSRYGKAALVTMAFDQRFAMVLVGSSGKGGATPLRRNFGESVGNLATGEYYWMAGNFLKYDAEKGRYGRMDAGDLPVDSDELIALCAPRATFISYGVPSAGDAAWLDHRGSWMATVAASPVFELLGANGLGVAGDYRTAPMPAVNQGLLDGRLAWRQHDGGHTDAPNMKYFIAWTDRQARASASVRPASRRP